MNGSRRTTEQPSIERARATPFIDAHIHLAQPRPARPTTGLVAVDASTDVESVVRRCLGELDRAGVDKAVVVGLNSEDRVLEYVDRHHGDRFASVATVSRDLTDPLGEIERQAARFAVQGVRFFGLGAAADSPVPTSTLAACEYLVSHEIPMWFYANREQTRRLPEVLQQHPQLRIVLNHSGFLMDTAMTVTLDAFGRPRMEAGPSIDSVIVDLARFESVSVVLSGAYAFSSSPYPHQDVGAAWRTLYALFGAHRLMTGSDYPFVAFEPGYQKTIRLVREHLGDIDSTELARVLGGNAAELFRFRTPRG